MKRQYQITTKNKKEYRAIITALYGLGFKCDHGGDWNVDTMVDQWAELYPVIVVITSVKTLSGNNSINPNHGPVVTLTQFLTEYVNDKYNQIEIQLNSKYSAIVSKDKITVGCQEFSFETFDKLANAVKTIRENNEL